MATKEVMVTAPALVFLYDRTFVAGSFREAWRQHRKVHLALAATWLLLAWLMAHARLQDRSVGYAGDFTWWAYALTESKVILEYLKLALWPHPLIFDYGPQIRVPAAQAAPYVLALGALAVATLIALWRRPRLGFLGAWWFVVLAPTSSVVPLALQPMAESRTYLPLAAVITCLVLGLYAWGGRKSLIVLFALALGGGWLTARRNLDYRSAVAIWTDTAEKVPQSARAHNNLADLLGKIPGRLDDAIAHYQAALRCDPEHAYLIHNNLGSLLVKIPDRVPEAVAQYEEAARLKPDDADIQNNLGSTLIYVPGRILDAVAHLEKAVSLKPAIAEYQYNLGAALSQVEGREDDAIAHLREALRLEPDMALAKDILRQMHAYPPAPAPKPGPAAPAIAKTSN